MINPELLEVNDAHHAGLAAVMAGEFEEGYDAYLEAELEYRADDNPLREGHVHRDMARALAGMGDGHGRNNAISIAIQKHHMALSDIRYPHDAAISEMGVTDLVEGRIAGARIDEATHGLGHTRSQENLVGLSVDRAMDRLRDQRAPDAYGREYYEQLVTHGPLLIALYAAHDRLPLGKSVADAARGLEMSRKRTQAAFIGRNLIRARRIEVPVNPLARLAFARYVTKDYEAKR